MKITTLLLISILAVFACGKTDTLSNSQGQAADRTTNAATPSAAADAEKAAETPALQTGPRTVMDFFALLPDEYFLLEGCDRATDKDCKKARAEYLKNYSEVVDIKNGYFKGGCDGGQRCIDMAIFKRPDGTYLVGVATYAEMSTEFYFLDYVGGKWTDVGEKVIPEYSTRNWYEIPRVGTTMTVYSRKYIEGPDDPDVSIRGAKQYDLVWKDGKFSKK